MNAFFFIAGLTIGLLIGAGGFLICFSGALDHLVDTIRYDGDQLIVTEHDGRYLIARRTIKVPPSDPPPPPPPPPPSSSASGTSTSKLPVRAAKPHTKSSGRTP